MGWRAGPQLANPVSPAVSTLPATRVMLAVLQSQMTLALSRPVRMDADAQSVPESALGSAGSHGLHLHLHLRTGFVSSRFRN